jgi:hypothetical protein
MVMPASSTAWASAPVAPALSKFRVKYLSQIGKISADGSNSPFSRIIIDRVLLILSKLSMWGFKRGTFLQNIATLAVAIAHLFSVFMTTQGDPDLGLQLRNNQNSQKIC